MGSEIITAACNKEASGLLSHSSPSVTVRRQWVVEDMLLTQVGQSSSTKKIVPAVLQLTLSVLQSIPAHHSWYILGAVTKTLKPSQCSCIEEQVDSSILDL